MQHVITSTTTLVPELLFWSKGFRFAWTNTPGPTSGQTRGRPWLAMTQIANLPTILPTDRDAVYIVTGGNRGLGLEHVRQFLEKTDVQVVATTTKDPSEAKNLMLFKDQGKGHRLTVVSLDLSDESSIKAAANKITQAHPGGIDLLLNNAGMQETIARATETTGSDYVCVLKTNVVGPYLTTKYLLPLLMKKKTKVIVNTSSLYDAMNATYDDPEGHHNPTGSVLLPSNSSKAALNMQSAVLANDLRDDGFTVVSLDTGWVRTETGNTTEQHTEGCAPLDVLTSVAGKNPRHLDCLLNVIMKELFDIISGQQKVIMALTQKQSGRYLNWDGKPPKEHPASHAFVTASAAMPHHSKAMRWAAKVHRINVPRLRTPFTTRRMLHV